MSPMMFLPARCMMQPLAKPCMPGNVYLFGRQALTQRKEQDHYGNPTIKKNISGIGVFKGLGNK